MGSGLRIPLPWEANQAARKQEHDLDERPQVDSTELRAGQEHAERVAADEDPDRTRRGAAGGAEFTYRELRKAGASVTRESVRNRMNQARARCARDGG